MLSFQHDLYPCQILPFSLHCSLFSAEYISSLSVLVARSVQFSQFSCSVISVVSNSFAPPLDLACQSPWAFPGKNTGLGCHFLLQRIFQTQGLNQCPAWQEDSLPLSYLESLHIIIARVK